MTLLRRLFNFIMAIDPICGMKEDEAKAKKKGLVVDGDKPVYFCSEDCKNKYLNKGQEPWYRSQTFARVFPWVLAVVLIGGSIWAYLGDFMILLSILISFCISIPAYEGKKFVIASSEACALCETPKASLTYISPKEANILANLKSFSSSSL